MKIRIGMILGHRLLAPLLAQTIFVLNWRGCSAVMNFYSGS